MEKGFWRLIGKLTLFVAVLVAGQACTKSDDLHTEENNYWHYCSSCHGREGKGNGMMAHDMPVRPNDHTDARIMSTRTDELLFKTISEGGEATGFDSGMPAHKKFLKKEEIQGLVKYIRKLCNCKYTT
ncbi:MAG: cytochrome c [Nitrospinae bacterium]|nr:cytochrome c [Nitrospinota bacterium]